jgi:hypothetical protein
MAATKYFFKSLIFNPIHLSSGKQVSWTRVGNRDGVVETTDATLIAPLTKLSTEGRLGVKEITKAEYDDLKKNGAMPLPDPYPTMRLSAMTPEPEMFQNAQVPDAVAGEPPAEEAPKKRASRQSKPSVAKGATLFKED